MKFVATILPDGSVKFVGGSETVQLEEGQQFYTYTTTELEIIMERKLEFNEDGTPILTPEETLRMARRIEIINSMKHLSARKQRRLLKRLRKENNRKKKESESALAVIDAQLAEVKGAREKYDLVFRDLRAWAEKPLVLEKPPSTLFHKLREATRDGEALITSQWLKNGSPTDYEEIWEEASVFVVEHDWAAAFKNATDYGTGEFRLPDDVCAFEFRISKMHIIAVTFEMDGVLYMHPSVLTDHCWFVPIESYKCDTDGVWRVFSPSARLDTMEPGKNDFFGPCAQLIGAQIKAVAIALDAEVAQTDVVRADHKLNRAREQRGRLPINSYHVVSLARRTRAAPLPRDPEHEPERHNRLHFVRGHWRHYETRKTWIKWHLRGDPDLGFIDKHYKL